MPYAREVKLAEIERVQLSVNRVFEGTETEAIPLSCFACFCTEGCMSSLGSVCCMHEAAEYDREVAQALVTLHDRAVEVLGEDGMARALRGRAGQAIIR
jgi:hypothetical protein